MVFSLSISVPVIGVCLVANQHVLQGYRTWACARTMLRTIPVVRFADASPKPVDRKLQILTGLQFPLVLPG